MVSRGTAGAMVVFSSIGAFTGGISGSWVYSSTKGAVLSLVRGWLALWAKRIRVNGVAPGAVDTRMSRDVHGRGHRAHEGSTPLARIADPPELASVCLFLHFDAAW